MNQSQLTATAVKPTVFVAALLPLAWLVWGALDDALGANPVETITHATGLWALRILLITLAITPIRRLTGWSAAIRLRRMLGLFAFFYVCLHFGTYIGLDQFFSLTGIAEDILERPYITVGFATFCALAPLAATSTTAMVRRLGAKRWQRLHRLAYVAGLGGVVHYLWLVKADLRDPLVYLAIWTLLMALRLPPVVKLTKGGRGATTVAQRGAGRA